MADEHTALHNFYSFVKNLFSRKQPETVRETIEDLIEEATVNGEEQFSQHEQLLLNNILCLRDKKCGNAMIPRSEIFGFQKDGTVVELAELMVNKGHSRIPVYGESLDDIIGVVHVIDLVKCLLKGEKDTKVSEVVTPNVKIVSQSKPVIDLLHEMQVNKVHMAIVVDEYGGVDGLVTIEDLLEEIVGNIQDEYDFEEDPVITFQDDGFIVADAKAEISEIKEIAGLDLYQVIPEMENDINTLGGLVFCLAQRIPSRGEIITCSGGPCFRILDVDPLRIKKVMIIPNQTDSTSETPADAD